MSKLFIDGVEAVTALANKSGFVYFLRKDDKIYKVDEVDYHSENIKSISHVPQSDRFVTGVALNG